MFSSSFSMENNIVMKFRFFGKHTFTEHQTKTADKLPFEMFFHVTKGELCLTSGNKSVNCREGETLFLPADAACELSSVIGCEVFFIGIDLRIYTSLRLFSLYAIPTLLSNAEVASLCRSVAATAEDNEFTNSRMENAVSLNADLLSLASAVLRLGAPLSDSSDFDRFKKLAPVLTHIGDCMGLPMEMEELSGLLGLDEGGFYRLFRSVTGEAPRDYLLSERFRNARLLLLETDNAIKVISEQCGYESPFSFSTLFRGRFGISPSDYRRKFRAFLSQ